MIPTAYDSQPTGLGFGTQAQPLTVPSRINGVPTPPLALDGFVVPHAVSFAAVWNATAKAYSYRWDEAVRDNRMNALAMKRDVFILSLLQERILPVANLQWALEVDDPNDPAQKFVQNKLTRVLRRTFRMRRLRRNLLQAIWYGRYGCQLEWERQPGGDWYVVNHAPVNGDKIQYQWDGTPCILLAGQQAARLRMIDPDAIIVSDAAGPMLRLFAAAYRGRFVIHQHDVDDADYFEGEMAGSRWGVGLRSYFYWAWWLRQQMLDWAISFMQKVGTTQLAIVNYADGNKAAKDAATSIANQLSGKIVITMPRIPSEKYAAVEIVTVDTKGIETLQSIIENYFEKRMERMAVGQSMSSGADNESGLGGSGRANFAENTKHGIIEWDADNLAETLTQDLVRISKMLNCPYATFPVRLVHSIPDPRAEAKIEQAERLVAMGISIDAADVRNTTGFQKPEPGAEVVGGQQPNPAMLPQAGAPAQQEEQKAIGAPTEGGDSNKG